MNPLVYGPIYCPVKWELSSNIMGITEDNCRVVLTEDQDNSTNQRSDLGGINRVYLHLYHHQGNRRKRRYQGGSPPKIPTVSVLVDGARVMGETNVTMPNLSVAVDRLDMKAS